MSGCSTRRARPCTIGSRAGRLLPIAAAPGRTPRCWCRGDASPRGPVKNKLIVMSNGEWLAPASVETETTWDAFVDVSHDAGTHWERCDIPLVHVQPGVRREGGMWDGLASNALWESDVDTVFAWDGVIQPTLWESVPGTIHALMRSTRGRVFRSDSLRLRSKLVPCLQHRATQQQQRHRRRAHGRWPSRAGAQPGRRQLGTSSPIVDYRITRQR